ncbi:hypothetical protein ABPG74_006652 [Tetrahymena malaccensis]
MTQETYPIEDVQGNKSPRKLEESNCNAQVYPAEIPLKKVDSEIDEMFKQLELELAKPLPPVKFWYKITFVFLGIASLAGWNAMLTAFDFFGAKYPKDQGYLDITFYFPIPIMITNFFAGLACPALARRFSYNQRIAYLSIGVCCFLITITLIAIFYNTKAGFWISFTLLFFQGFIESVVTNSLIALAGMISHEINAIYWTCTAASGLVMNFIRLIALGAVGDTPSSMNVCTAIYFAFACLIYIVSASMQAAFTKTEYFKALEHRHNIKSRIENREMEMDMARMMKEKMAAENNANNGSDNQLKTEQALSQVNLEQQKKSKKNGLVAKLLQNPFIQYLIYLSQVFKYAGAIPVFLVFIYIQTFMMFPGVSIFQKPTYTIIPYPYAAVWMITCYNFGDLVGKYLGSIKALEKLYFIYFVVMLRFVYYVLFLMTANEKGGDAFQNDVFAWTNQLMFAITNGFATTGLMNLGPRKCKDPKIINLINFIGGFSITFGIAIGTFLALPLAKE